MNSQAMGDNQSWQTNMVWDTNETCAPVTWTPMTWDLTATVQNGVQNCLVCDDLLEKGKFLCPLCVDALREMRKQYIRDQLRFLESD